MVVESGSGWIAGALLFACLAGGVGRASDATAEALAPERRSALSALHERFAAARDVWSALQLESYARARGLDLPPVVGATRLIGDPLRSFPMTISQVWEGAGWTVVAAYDRLYFLDQDGCPLRGSLALGRAPMRLGLSRYAQHLCTIDRAEHGPWRVAISRLADGVETLHATIAAHDGEFYAYEPDVADDGSAVMFSILGHAPPDGHDAYRTLAVTRDGVRETAQRLGQIGIGPDARWLAVWNDRTAHAEMRSGERSVECGKITCGGGSAACTTADGLQVAQADGTLATVPAPFPLGRNPDLATIGDWLVISSDSGVDQRVAFYRWSELGADPLAPPVRVLEGRCDAMRRDPGAAWLTHGRDYAAIDCSGAVLRVTPLGTASEPIQAVRDEFDRCLIRCAAGVLVCEPAGAEVWRGPCNGWYLITPDLLVIRRDQDGRAPHRLVHLARSARERVEVPLELDARAWRVVYDHTHDLLIARCGGAGARLDPRTGRVLPGPEEPYEERVDRPGRLIVDGARLVPRAAAPLRMQEHLLCKDAWRLAGSTWMVSAHSHLLEMSAAGQWVDHGACPGATRLGMDDRGRLVMLGHGSVYIATVVTAAGRITFVRDPATARQELEGVSWLLQRDGTFTPPGGSALQWDDAVGFRPISVRAASAAALLAITESVVLELTPAAATALAKPAGRP